MLHRSGRLPLSGDRLRGGRGRLFRGRGGLGCGHWWLGGDGRDGPARAFDGLARAPLRLARAPLRLARAPLHLRDLVERLAKAALPLDHLRVERRQALGPHRASLRVRGAALDLRGLAHRSSFAAPRRGRGARGRCGDGGTTDRGRGVASGSGPVLAHHAPPRSRPTAPTAITMGASVDVPPSPPSANAFAALLAGRAPEVAATSSCPQTVARPLPLSPSRHGRGERSTGSVSELARPARSCPRGTGKPSAKRPSSTCVDDPDRGLSVTSLGPSARPVAPVGVAATVRQRLPPRSPASDLDPCPPPSSMPSPRRRAMSAAARAAMVLEASSDSL